MEKMKINDIADELLILNKHTIDTLFSLENNADCIALYVFLYKTAKWQKTNVIKATEEYIKTSLGWGYDKIRRTKNILASCGLINKVQYRKDNKIEGWFIEISYLVSKEKELQVLESNGKENLDVGNPTGRNEEINALKYNNICLKKENDMLKNKILELENKEKEEQENNNYNTSFSNNNTSISKKEILKKKAKEIYDYWNSKSKKLIKHQKLTEKMIKAYEKAKVDYTDEQIKTAIDRYDTIMNDENFFWHYPWGLEVFLKQSNTLPSFLDDGSMWNSYLSWKNGTPKPRQYQRPQPIDIYPNDPNPYSPKVFNPDVDEFIDQYPDIDLDDFDRDDNY